MTSFVCSFFFFNDTASTEIYTLSLHDALPILTPIDDDYLDVRFAFAVKKLPDGDATSTVGAAFIREIERQLGDRKSTRLNSSHTVISYAVFCLKKKNKNKTKTGIALLTLRERT